MHQEVRRPGVSAEDLVSVVRVHVDRVHDAVRRAGACPDAAVDVVGSSALALVDAVAHCPEQVPDAVGWWFAAALDQTGAAADARRELPLGGGLLATDEDQLVLAETLEELSDDERLAVLVRDAYRLPTAALAAALRTDEERAEQVLAQARLHAVPLLDDEPAPPVPPHADLAALARLGEGGPVARQDAAARRHVQVCAACAAVTQAQSRVQLLLSGLAVVALPDAARAELLGHVEDRAHAVLPPAADLVLSPEEWDAWEDVDDRVLPPLLAVLGMLLAVVVGTVAGVLLSRGGSVLPLSSGVLPPVTLPPVVSPTPLRLEAEVPPPPPVPTPRTTVYYLAPRTTAPAPARAPAPAPVVTPTPTPTPVVTPPPPPSPTSSPARAAALAVEPRSGPNGARLRVTGTGWTPGEKVVVEYLDAAGRPTGSRADATVDDAGGFQTVLVARDPTGLPGRHTVRATSPSTTRTAPYDATA